jgi:hypothetical protein
MTPDIFFVSSVLDLDFFYGVSKYSGTFFCRFLILVNIQELFSL